MHFLLAFAVISAGLFLLGYHLGNQLGRTAHIRDSLARARTDKLVARIENH